jgi:hypothetical protein
MTLTTASEGHGGSALLGVRVRADDLTRAVAAYKSVIGVKAQRVADGFVLHFGHWRILLSDAAVPAVAVHDGKPRVGIWGVDLALADPEVALARLAAQGHEVALTPALSGGPSAAGPAVVGHVDCSGVRVFLTALAARPSQALNADVVLDHVALLVSGFDAPSRLWETLTGMPSHRIDVHPVSNGTFGAVRFLLGECMIELVVPLPGTESVLATRLATVGEGPVTLALPARDLSAKRAQLTGTGVLIVERPPHWFVRPAEVAGALVQLTPRVNH